jgi:hypothetical protein
MVRNANVEAAVHLALDQVDAYIGGAKVVLPQPANRRACDCQLAYRSGSVRLASMFLAFYSTRDKAWDCRSVPTGIRGAFGDKLLAEQITRRDVTLHDAITAFGENLGWKGNVKHVRLQADPRFGSFCGALKKAGLAERALMAGYMAARFAESRRKTRPLPPVGDDVLTFARAKELFSRLLELKTEGHVQQFLVAAMLAVQRRRYGFEIRTHHPHAADKYDEVAGDIEEFRAGTLIGAYEVTVRPDWKNRLSGFKAKMDRFRLPKYVVIAGNVNSDDELAVPARLIAWLEPLGRDIAVVDIQDLVTVMSAELSAVELRAVVNLAYEFLSRRDLCGRPAFLQAYRDTVDAWLDEHG